MIQAGKVGGSRGSAPETVLGPLLYLCHQECDFKLPGREGHPPTTAKRLRRKAMADKAGEFVASKLPITCPPLTPVVIAWITMSCRISGDGTEYHPQLAVYPAPTRGYSAQEQWN
jgi:hypothetical protein